MPSSPSGVVRALARARRGAVLSPDEATWLLSARGDALEELLGIAGALRDRGLEEAGRPGVITYSRKVFVPLTTLCRDRCHYCTFLTTPGQLRKDGKPPYLSPDEVLDITSARMISRVEGGMIWPSVPAAQTIPDPSRRS